MSDEATAAKLAARTSGPVWSRAAVDRSGYDEGRSGFNSALDHQPALVLAAATAADVAAGISFAAENGLPVDLQATGHGAHRAMDGGLLVTTRHLTGVDVDPGRRVARISAGATAADVIAATAPHGLAAAVGAAPGVGFVSYTIGGGLGLLGRAHGYAADWARRLEVVTADGRELAVTQEQHPELFWALRGGGGNLAAVTAMEVDLIPVPVLYGGGLFFSGDRAPDVLEAFRRAITTAPPELTLSLAFVAFPDLPVVPPPLRGEFCGHVRVAYLGERGAGEPLIAPLRAAAPFLDTVGVLPLTEMGAIHGDPVGPMPVSSNSVALSGDEGLDDLLPLVQPDAPFMLELRHLGGALTQPRRVPSAVGHRAAMLNLFTSAYPGTVPDVAASAQQRACEAVAAASVGGPLRNFLPTQYPEATTCYEPAAAELARLKTTWDPDDTFRFAPAVRRPPAGP
jgi:FAD binding domain